MAEEVNVTEFLGLTGIDQIREGLRGSGSEVKDSIDKARTAIKPLLKDISDEFEKIGRKLKADIASAVGGGTGGSSTGRTTIVGGIDKAKAAKVEGAAEAAGDAAAAVAGKSGIGTRMLGGLKGGGVSAGLQLANMGINAATSRFDRGRDGVLAADRMSVLYQQMTGLSQLGVSSQYRMPLTQYRLGAGGINELMGMEAQIGIGGTRQAAGVEALRTMSGYQMSTGDVTSMISNLSSAPVANRMFMMTGTGIVGPGGQQNSIMSVMKSLVNSAGLTNEKAVKDALLPGSVTRAKLTAMGVPPDMQTQVIQYAQQNLTYKSKGGQGMYDPSRKDARRIMGIEENFATQVEETQRIETERDEKFYRRQVDNFASLERQTQTLTRVFGALEDKLSGILGAVGSNRIATTMFQGVSSFLGGDPSHKSGDGPTDDAKVTVPTWGNRKTLNEVKNMSSFKNLHPKMQDRLLRMMRDNPNVGFGTGVRDQNAQRRMFLERYRATSSETNASGKKNIFWDGKYWEHVSGAPAAPPGRSMHEVGLAADLTGDTAWVAANAHKYGLKHFGDVNNEPWHVQPEELPNSRAKYEESGAIWGHGPAGAAPFEADSDFGSTLDEHGGVSDTGTTFGSADSYDSAYGSVSQRVASRIGAPAGGAVGAGSGLAKGSKKVRPRRGKLSGEQVAMLLYQMGFRGEDIAKGVAISKRESGWESTAHNPNRSTGDNSYGLFQINMIEKYAASRRQWFGIQADDELFDPMANVRATKLMFDSGKSARGNGWYDWGPYKGKPETYNTDMTEATNIVQSLELGGDPSGSASRSVSGSSSMSVTSGHTFNISPNIVMSGGGSPADLERMAREVAVLIKREIELQALRSS
jgi:hypothetical protein